MSSNLTALARILSVEPNDVASSIFNQYASRLVKLAKKKLEPTLQRKIAPDDIVQSALKSFFRSVEKDRLQLSDEESLWGMLVVYTLRKCSKWEDHFLAIKRDTRREAKLNSSSASQSVSFLLECQEPTAHEAVVLAEMLERLLDQFGDRQQEMVRMRLQGFEVEEIAIELKSSRRTVARVIAEAKGILKGMLDSE